MEASSIYVTCRPRFFKFGLYLILFTRSIIDMMGAYLMSFIDAMGMFPKALFGNEMRKKSWDLSEVQLRKTVVEQALS